MVAKPLVEKLVEKLIAPAINNFVNSCKSRYNEDLIPKAEHFEEYILRTYDKYSIINTLVLKNAQLKLKDIYVAQTLIKEIRYNDQKEVTAKIDQLPVELIKEYKKILIKDTAGMGKSTITRRMFIDIIDKSLADVGIPIYIELNRLSKDHNIITEIQEGLNSLSKEFDKKLLLNLIQKGGFIFFLDGYDEISIADRISVTKDIQSFISKAGKDNYYILTSRPEDGLTTFGDFQAFKIKALTEEEAFELLGKYDTTPDKENSNKIIEKLKSGDYDSIYEYLENPLLVSLLFAAYDYKPTIPLKKHLFYRQVYEAFFETHDLTKGIEAHQKRSGLDVDDFSRILRYIGFACLRKIGVKFDKDTILKEIEEAKGYCANLNFQRTDFFSDLLTSVPLFCKDGNEYKWVHKSLMEYFAARFIAEDAKDKQDQILKSIYNSESATKYINLLDLYYDIDNNGFAKNIELPLLKDYIRFYDEKFFESSKIYKSFIEERIGNMFAYTQIYIDTIKGNSGVKEAKEQLKKRLGNPRFVNVSRLKDIYIGLCYQPQRAILSILLERKNELFARSFSFHRIIRKSDFDMMYNMIYKMEPKIIDVHTGEEDRIIYENINILLDHSDGWYLNYNMCCREVEKIEKQIEKNNDSSLLEGI